MMLASVPSRNLVVKLKYTNNSEEVARLSGRVLMATLKMIVKQYCELGHRWNTPIALSEFGLSVAETEKTFGGLDEDYHISRHLHFSKAEGRAYQISGEKVTHVAMDAAITHLL